MKKHRITIPNPDGTFTYMQPTNSLWYVLYVNREPGCKKEKELFQKRFCLSYNLYNNILNEIKEHKLFSCWLTKDAAGEPPVPINSLLLGFLRYVGREFTCNDL